VQVLERIRQEKPARVGRQRKVGAVSKRTTRHG
jgi:hypothetical protein